jgi:hypothetical protein
MSVVSVTAVRTAVGRVRTGGVGGPVGSSAVGS